MTVHHHQKKEIDQALSPADGVTTDVSEFILKSFFEEASLGMAIVSLTNKMIKANKAFAEMLGFTQEELMHLTFRELTHPDDLQRTQALFDQITKREITNYSIEKRFVCKNGAFIWVNVHVATVQDSQARPLFLTIQVENITEKKKTADALLEKENQLQLFIKHSPAALCMMDKDMRYLAVSTRWLKDYNLGDVDVIGKSHYEVFQTIPQRWKDTHQRCLAGAVEKSDEDSFTREDGSIEWLKWEIQPWRKSNGEIGGIIMLTEVITAIKESELMFRNLVERSMVGVYIYQDGKLVYINDRYAEIFGYQASELQFMDAAEKLIYEPDKAITRDHIVSRITGVKDSVQYEVRGVKKNGDLIWIDILGANTLFHGAPAIIGSVIDITDRVRAQELITEKATQLAVITDNLLDSMVYQVIRELDGRMNFVFVSSGSKNYSVYRRMRLSGTRRSCMTSCIRMICRK